MTIIIGIIENIIAIFREDCEINPKIIKHKTSKGKNFDALTASSVKSCLTEVPFGKSPP